jgi:hypothetical protein
MLGKERDKLILGVVKTDNWPISKNRLIREHFKSFSKFIREISLEKLNEMKIEVIYCKYCFKACSIANAMEHAINYIKKQ